ncbi:MAG TPA: hypothetical protein VMT61_13610 [Candidatus Binataceae bacterium]|nr:hypothetical protein [Candidatus Binataceae bacterium]
MILGASGIDTATTISNPAADEVATQATLSEAEYEAAEGRWSQKMVATGPLIVLAYQFFWLLFSLILQPNQGSAIFDLHLFNVALALVITVACTLTVRGCGIGGPGWPSFWPEELLPA